MKKIIIIVIFLISNFIGFSNELNYKLYQAVEKNQIAEVKELLEEGADPNTYVSFNDKELWVNSGDSPFRVNVLIKSVLKNNLEIVEILLKNKADVNWKDGFNTDALIYAVGNKNLKMIKLLIEYGADVNSNDGQGNSVQSEAIKTKNKEIIEFIELKLKK